MRMTRDSARLTSFLFAMTLLAALCAPVRAQEKAQGQGQGLERREDMIEEEVPGRPDLVKVTHIFKDKRARPQGGASCTCGGPEGADYTLQKVKWFDATLPFTIYTAGSGVTDTFALGNAVRSSFLAWTAAEPAAPAVMATQNDGSSGPGINLDGEQTVSWRPLSAEYGSNTLAVTVYWYSRVKVNGFSKISHFDMAFNTDYAWGISSAGNACGGDGNVFDVQNVGTHEAGHAYGVGHNNGCNLTMNPTAGPGETTKSTLGTGDINGIKAIY